MPHLQPCDLTICYNNEDGTASAGGYKIESLLLKQGSSPMITMSGGKKSDKVSDCFRDLAVLLDFYVLQRLDARAFLWRRTKEL